MDDLSTLGPLALGLLAWGLGLAALMTRRTGLCAPSLGCCAVALSLVPLHVYLEVEAGCPLFRIQRTPSPSAPPLWFLEPWRSTPRHGSVPDIKE